jgi:predicted transcriptional regulator
MAAQTTRNSGLEVPLPTADGTLELATKIVAAYVSNNPIPASELAGLIKTVHGTLGGLSGSLASATATGQTPAVPIRKSVTPDFIICLEDGKKLKMLKRYLRTRFKLSPEAYRTKWALPPDYPMVAPDYAARRSEFAKKIGLGRSSKHEQRRKKG